MRNSDKRLLSLISDISTLLSINGEMSVKEVNTYFPTQSIDRTRYILDLGEAKGQFERRKDDERKGKLLVWSNKK